MTGNPTNTEQRDEMSETIEERQQRLQAELAEIERQQREHAEAERRQRVAEKQAQMDPALAEQANEIEKRAAEQLDREYPPPWRPHKADSTDPAEVVGMVTRIDPQVGPSPQFGTYSAAVEVVTTTGESWTIWAEHRGVLFSQLRRLRVQPGELIAVRYLGKKHSDASGFTYNNYKLVRVDDDDTAAPVDYDQINDTAEQQQLPPGDKPAPDDDIPF